MKRRVQLRREMTEILILCCCDLEWCNSFAELQMKWWELSAMWQQFGRFDDPDHHILMPTYFIKSDFEREDGNDFIWINVILIAITVYFITYCAENFSNWRYIQPHSAPNPKCQKPGKNNKKYQDLTKLIHPRPSRRWSEPMIFGQRLGVGVRMRQHRIELHTFFQNKIHSYMSIYNWTKF